MFERFEREAERITISEHDRKMLEGPTTGTDGNTSVRRDDHAPISRSGMADDEGIGTLLDRFADYGQGHWFRRP